MFHLVRRHLYQGRTEKRVRDDMTSVKSFSKILLTARATTGSLNRETSWGLTLLIGPALPCRPDHIT